VSVTSYDAVFTGIPDDGGCGAGSVCEHGACTAGCYINGAFVAPNTANGSDSCESCTPAQVVSNWTNATDGTACTGNGGYYCQNGQCENVCDIAGQLLSNGSSDPANTCQSCQTANDPTNWSPVTVGAVTCSSNGGNYCVEGSCALACDISGAVLDAGALDTTNGCQSCQPSLAATAFSPVTDGTTCSTGGTYCVGGNCANDCQIGGVLLADGTIDGGNPNVCCNVAKSPAGWTAGFSAATGSLTTGTSPEGIAIGDLSGDGGQDIVVTNYGDATVGIFYGQGGGTFAAQTTVSVGTLPQAVALADFNGDTLLDIAVANNGSSNVTVLLNQGDGGFQSAIGSPVSVGTKPTSIAVGSFQQPGSNDLVVADSVSGKIGVLLSNGNGTFQGQSTYPAGTTPMAVAVADFNGDSHPDIAVVNSGSSNAMVLVNSGNGSNFSLWATATVGTLPQAIAAVDLAGNSQPDLVVGDSTGTISAFLNTGTSLSATPVTVTVGGLPTSIATGDFNGDGKLDLAITDNSASQISVLINESTATAIVFAPPVTYNVGSSPFSIAAGLFTSGSQLDLAVTNNGANTVSVLLGQCP
jgi:ankyrin repeat protein